MIDVEVKFVEQKVSKKKNTQYPEELWRHRTGKEFALPSFAIVAKNAEAVWWNRTFPEDAPEFITKGNDGLYCENIPYWGFYKQPGVNTFKTKYNFLLPKNSILTVVAIKYDEKTTKEDKEKIKDFFRRVYVDTFVTLGCITELFSSDRSDLSYNNKKIGGLETIETDDCFTHCGCITCQYLPEKKLFDRLTGTYAHHKEITGICEETTIKKEDIEKELLRRFNEFFNGLR